MTMVLPIGTCPHRPGPDYGSYIGAQVNKTTWYVGDSARFVCMPHYRITGHGASSCRSSGRWSSAVPSCSCKSDIAVFHSNNNNSKICIV